MQKSANIIAAIIMIATLHAVSYSQEMVFDNAGKAREAVFYEQIRTIQFYRKGWINSYPVLTIHEDIPLILEFDDLSDRIENYSYLVIHCDADWNQSDLMEQEYMDGYFENPVQDIESSFNTYFNYYHYRLSLPNDDIRLKVSGNYLLVVFRSYNVEEVVFTRRFMISEASATINAVAKRPVLTKYRDHGHEIDITIEHQHYRIDDPFSETTLSIYQNGVWDHEIHGLKPLFVNPGELVYDYQGENIFMAGNEFRTFNITNTRVREYHVRQIEFLDQFHFELMPDEANPAHLYFDRDDMNGKYFIEAESVSDPSLEADYAYVHFTLQMPLRINGGSVYIAGALTNWQFTNLNKMQYDLATRTYRGSLLLKQGIYNYRYIFLPDNAGAFDISEIEGSHYQTRNEYLILFYHRGQGDRYDRLIGHQVIHSTAG